ncbi:GntT/GntP/DsdX family permease [Kytococcus sp. Marseille-QA3725]
MDPVTPAHGSGVLLLLGQEHDRDGLTEAECAAGADERHMPAFGTVLGLLLLPMVLIAGKTVTGTLVSAGTLQEDSGLVAVLTLLGDTPIALLITLLAAILLIRVGGGRDGLQKLLDDALAPPSARSSSSPAPVWRRRSSWRWSSPSPPGPRCSRT